MTGRDGMNESKTATEPQLNQATTIQVPGTTAAALFLKHAVLTPAQREYLYAIAASYGSAQVRGLINRHYLNVLHRCIWAGCRSNRDGLGVAPVTSPEIEREKYPSKTQGDFCSGAKHEGGVFELIGIKTQEDEETHIFTHNKKKKFKKSQDQAVGGGGGGGGGSGLFPEQMYEFSLRGTMG